MVDIRRMTMPTLKRPKMERTKKHHKQVLKALREVIAQETWQKTYGDERLAELIKAKGVYATHCIVYSVRVGAGIGDAYERKMDKYAASARGK
jgi:DNA-directed RNA polymerase specialized sigma54-like protein